MIYYRCKCGKLESHSSMGVPDCYGCDVCGTTLAAHPSGHRAPKPHDEQGEWRIADAINGFADYVLRCRNCNRTRVVGGGQVDQAKAWGENPVLLPTGDTLYPIDGSVRSATEESAEAAWKALGKAADGEAEKIRCDACGWETVDGTSWENGRGKYTLGTTHVCDRFAYGKFVRAADGEGE